jgi:hypothetical protein
MRPFHETPANEAFIQAVIDRDPRHIADALDSGASNQTLVNGENALSHILGSRLQLQDSFECLALLVGSGLDLDAPFSSGITPLSTSIILADIDIGCEGQTPANIQCLLDNGANLDAFNASGNTALGHCVDWGCWRQASLLLALGSNPDAGLPGHTAIDLLNAKPAGADMSTRKLILDKMLKVRSNFESSAFSLTTAPAKTAMPGPRL